MPAPTRTFTARHVQLARAALAAVAALMITFSPDHSATVGLTVFSGFSVTLSLVLFLAAGFVYAKGQRWPAVAMGAVTVALGVVASFPALHTDGMFFGLIIAWAAATGLIELISGLRTRGAEGARDAITIGGLGLLLALLLLLIPVNLAQDYVVEGSAFVLTGIILGVGMFGGYAAIVAVFLGIAGLAPVAEKKIAENDVTTDAGVDRLADHGGIA